MMRGSGRKGDDNRSRTYLLLFFVMCVVNRKSKARAAYCLLLLRRSECKFCYYFFLPTKSSNY